MNHIYFGDNCPREMKMKKFLTAALIVLASPVAAQECLVAYKASMSDPFKLHYGVLVQEVCDPFGAEEAIKARIEPMGWTLLTVVGEVPSGEREQALENAGDFVLE